MRLLTALVDKGEFGPFIIINLEEVLKKKKISNAAMGFVLIALGKALTNYDERYFAYANPALANIVVKNPGTLSDVQKMFRGAKNRVRGDRPFQLAYTMANIVQQLVASGQDISESFLTQVGGRVCWAVR